MFYDFREKRGKIVRNCEACNIALVLFFFLLTSEMMKWVLGGIIIMGPWWNHN